jgi:hypothetical protein
MADKDTTRFPFIDLRKALTRAEELYQADKGGKSVAVPTAFSAWGYSSKSSGGFQTVSALKMYGLAIDEGANEDRRLRLTDAARSYFMTEVEDDKAKALSKFALSPRFFRSLWDQWGDAIPPDNVARTYLKVERGLAEQLARTALNLYKENIAFAMAKGGAKAEEPDEQEETEEREQRRNPPDNRRRPADQSGRLEMLSAERELQTGILSRNAGFRVLVTGQIGVAEIERLIAKLEMDKEILADPEPEDDFSDPDTEGVEIG